MRLRHLLAALAVALTACGGGPADGAPSGGEVASTSTTAEPIDPRRRSQEIRSADALGEVDVITAIEQPRYLQGTRRITVPVRFDGTGRFRITGIAVRTPAFDPLPVEPMEVVMVPGQRTALQVDLGDPVCDGPVGRGPLVHLVVAHDDGPATPLEVPIPSWLVDELHEDRCAQEAVERQAGIRFADTGSRDGATVRTHLLLERGRGRKAVALTEATGSVILVLDAGTPGGDGPLAELAPGDDVVRVPATVTAARCDAHAVSGSTRTFVFRAWLQVAGEDPVLVEVRPGPELEPVLQDAIEACVAASDTDPRDD